MNIVYHWSLYFTNKSICFYGNANTTTTTKHENQSSSDFFLNKICSLNEENSQTKDLKQSLRFPNIYTCQYLSMELGNLRSKNQYGPLLLPAICQHLCTISLQQPHTMLQPRPRTRLQTYTYHTIQTYHTLEQPCIWASPHWLEGYIS